RRRQPRKGPRTPARGEYRRVRRAIASLLQRDDCGESDRKYACRNGCFSVAAMAEIGRFPRSAADKELAASKIALSFEGYRGRTRVEAWGHGSVVAKQLRSRRLATIDPSSFRRPGLGSHRQKALDCLRHKAELARRYAESTPQNGSSQTGVRG